MNEAEWVSCCGPDLMLKSMRQKPSRRKLRLFAAACCRRSWSLLDEQSRFALEKVERFADGGASESELDAASESARLAFQAQRLRVFSSIVGAALALQSLEAPRGLFELLNSQQARDAHDAAD